MNKTTKGSLAAGAAAVLLLGGAGSLAYWTDNATVNGGQVNSGFLTLDAVPEAVDADGNSVQDCTTPAYAAGFAGAGDPVVNFVPGDVVSTVCTFVIGAEGDNLAATPDIPDSVDIDGPADTSFTATVASTYELGPDADTLAGYDGTDAITEDNDGDLLVATITVTFPFGSDEDGNDLGGNPNADGIVNANDTQNIDAVLDDLTVSLTQDDPQAP